MIDSSGPKTRSCGTLLLACSLDTIFRVMSGESIDLPREFAYFRNITSRTVSTRSSSLTATRVADAPGRLTHIFFCIISSSSSDGADWVGDNAGDGAGKGQPGGSSGSVAHSGVAGSKLTCADDEVESSTSLT